MFKSRILIEVQSAKMNVPGAFGKPFKCLCCKNPWNESDSDASGAFLCNPCLTDDKGYTGIDPTNFDSKVSPKENFYLWSNGGWKASNPIPLEYSSWNTFIVLRDLNLERLKGLLDELSNEEPKENTAKLADYYVSFMDEPTIESRGVAVLSEVFGICNDSKMDITTKVAKLHALYGLNILFGVSSSPDKSNSDHSLCSLYQGGLGLPDRDYYFDADKENKRTKYVEYITTLFRLLGASGVDNSYMDASYCTNAANAVLAFETQLAKEHLTRTASRDPQVTFNKMSVGKLSALARPQLTWAEYLTSGVQTDDKCINWEAYFAGIGKSSEHLGEINVSAVHAITGLSRILSRPKNASPLQHYLIFHALNSFAPHLPAAFADAQFDFFEKELKGTVQQLPRWKRALQALEALGEELGQLYVAKYFPADAKQRALEVVEEVRDALRERLLEVDWMSEETRREAMVKMEKFKVKIGFPDKWLDYSSMHIQRGAHFENVLATRRFSHQLELSRMNAPTDKARWFMTPQTVNAYYHPSLNEIVFPAAILQAPFFDASADAAVQFGSLGAVVGHEMTHGFDDQGRKYDSVGNLRDWWAGTDGEEYEKRAAVMISQAEKFEVYGLKLNGKLTCGENIADLGGVKLALRALKRHLAAQEATTGQPAPLINGFSPEQRLFLAWSQAWRENVKKERAMQLVTLDPHGPNEMRCNGTLRNVPEFLQAFEIQEGDAMYLPPEQRVDIW